MFCLKAITIILAVLGTGRFLYTRLGKELGCHLGNDYKLNILGAHTSQPIWGDPVKPMIFKTEKEFKQFYDRVVQIRKDVNEKFPVNDLDTIIKLNTEFEKSNQKSIKAFTESYVPNPDTRQDNLGLILRVLKTIGGEMPWTNVKEHSYIAAADLGVDKNALMAMKVYKDPVNAPVNEFHLDHVVGVIKIQVADRLGFIILDMEYAINSVVMKKETAEFISFGGRITFEVVGQHDGYIQIDEYSLDKTSNIRVRKSQSAVYVQRPLCSFVKAVNQMIWTTPVQNYAKLSADGQVQVFVFVHMFHKRKLSLNDDRFCLGFSRSSPNSPEASPKRAEFKNSERGNSDSDSDVQLEVATFKSVDKMSEEDDEISDFVAQMFNTTPRGLKDMLKDVEGIAKKFKDAFEKDSVSTKPILYRVQESIEKTKSNSMKKKMKKVLTFFCMKSGC